MATSPPPEREMMSKCLVGLCVKYLLRNNWQVGQNVLTRLHQWLLSQPTSSLNLIHCYRQVMNEKAKLLRAVRRAPVLHGTDLDLDVSGSVNGTLKDIASPGV